MLLSRMTKLGDIISQCGILSKLHVVPDADIERLEAESRPSILPKSVVNSQKKAPVDVAGLFKAHATRPHTGVSLPLGCLSTGSTSKKRFYVYILECEPKDTGNLYVGQTEKIAERLWQHLIGIGAGHTQFYKPCGLIHLEIRESRKESLKREAELIKMVKSGTPINPRLPSEFSKFFNEVKKASDKYQCRHLFDIRKNTIPIPLVEEWGDIEW
jgi:predicted GIY-YIG superfamily endonuclease